MCVCVHGHLCRNLYESPRESKCACERTCARVCVRVCVLEGHRWRGGEERLCVCVVVQVIVCALTGRQPGPVLINRSRAARPLSSLGTVRSLAALIGYTLMINIYKAGARAGQGRGRKQRRASNYCRGPELYNVPHSRPVSMN